MRQRDIFFFWLPLFSSWLLMTAEGPLISAAINRLPNEVVMLAAMGIVFSLAVALESPIINLLATSTALVRDLESYRLVRRFTVHWMLGLTFLSAVLIYPPLFHTLVVRWMGTPEEIAQWVLPGMRIMVPWSAAIAWRRFLQGVLIGQNQARWVAYGTALRLALSGGMAVGLAVWGDLSGVVLGAIALMGGVVAEALFSTFAARPAIRSLPERSREPGENSAALTYRDLFRFHLPLASTSVLTLLLQPLVAACLARLARPVETLAAWPVIFQFMLLMRATAFALPEVVIALGKRGVPEASIRKFSRNIALVSVALMAIFTVTPLASFYLVQLQSASPGVSELAREGFWILIPLPALATLISWLRGRLIHAGRTRPVNEAMFARLAATLIVLGAGLALGASGIATAAGSVVLSGLVEWGYLAFRTRSTPWPERSNGAGETAHS